MNENDKILINAYLDDELLAAETKYIESLINSDDDANDYANKIKNANHEINSFFKSSEFDELEEGVDSFINEHKLKNKKSKFQFNFFNNYKFAGGIMAFAIMGLLIVPSFIEQDQEFFNINIEREGYLNKDGLDINQIISDTLVDMLDEDMKKANLVIGSEIILISINGDLENCISGNFLYDNIDYQFESCLVDGLYETEFN